MCTGGETELQFGSRHIYIQAGEGALIPQQNDTDGCKIHRNRRQHELVLFFEPEWLAHTEVPSYLGRLTEPCRFVLTPHMSLLCRQLEQDSHTLQQLYRESRSIALLLEVLQHIRPDAPQSLLSTATAKRNRHLIELMHSGEADGMTIKQMTQACHSNPTTLQRGFQAEYGQSIATYLHQIKMQRAAALLHSGANIRQAAQAAGYRHSENFSRAFVKMFGYYPCRGRRP